MAHLALILLDLVHHDLQMPRHIIDALRQNRHLILRTHSGSALKIAVGNPLRYPAQLLHRFYNTV